jgi:hypothetical protein
MTKQPLASAASRYVEAIAGDTPQTLKSLQWEIAAPIAASSTEKQQVEGCNEQQQRQGMVCELAAHGVWAWCLP